MSVSTSVTLSEADIASDTAVESVPRPLLWTGLARIGFRISFLYFVCFLFFFGNGSIFEIFPVVGNWIDDKLTWPTNHLAVWIGHHAFHLSGPFSEWHPTGSGDTRLNWILNGTFVVFAVAGGLIWTGVAMLRGNRRKEYQTMYAWLRFLLRLTVGFFMLNYGMAKVFPIQMASISVGILNEPVGQMSPMTMLWAMIGLNPVYESICGLAEVVGGLLILFRRTALLGSLFTAFVISNVVLYNFFFDVPVKLFAVNLLLAALFVVLPDAQPLIDFFLRHKAAAPAGIWVPPTTRKSFRIATRTIELIFTIAFIVGMPIYTGLGWRQLRAASRVASPLLGSWHVDASHPPSGAFVTGEGLPASDLYIDNLARGMRRSTDGALWRTGFRIDPKAPKLTINPFPGEPVTYAWQMPDANHLVLTSTPPDAPPSKAATGNKPTDTFTPAIVSLTRTPVPAHYPLLDRGFHLVNEWGLER